MPCAAIANRTRGHGGLRARACRTSPSSTSRSKTSRKADSSCAGSCAALSAELPIIFLTARDSELDAVSGLRLGADDFLTKDSQPRASDRTRERAVPPRRCTAPPAEAGQIIASRCAARSTPSACRSTWNEQRRAAVAHGVLDRVRAREASRPREESPAAHGRRERRARRQHHHVAHQAHPPQVPGRRREVRCRAHRVRHGLPLGRVQLKPWDVSPTC